MIPIWKKLGLVGGAVGVPTATITHVRNGTFVMELRGDNGAVIYCDPGNGSPVQPITLLGISTPVPFTYSNDGTVRTVRMTGQLPLLQRIDCESMSATALDLTALDPWYFIYLFLNDNALVDLSCLRKFSNMANCYFYDNSVTDISFLEGWTNPGYRLYGYNNPVTYTSLTLTNQTSNTKRFNSCLSTAGEVDQILIDMAAANWSNGTVYLDGTNPARTAASDAAVAALVLAGVTLHLS